MSNLREIPWAAKGTSERERLTHQASEKLQQARISLIFSAPFFGQLSQYLDFVLLWPEDWPQSDQGDAGLPCTAACNGKRIIWNPMFVLSLPHEELCTILCHEVLHPALGHLARLYDRDPVLWNIATDYVINAYIEDFIKNTKSRAQHWKMGMGGLLDHKYDGLTSDGVYDLVMKEAKKKGKDGQGQNISIRSKGQGRSRKDAEDDIQKGRTSMEADPDLQDPEKADKAEREWTDRMVSAAQTARGQGNMPAGLERLIDEILKPVIDWREVLSRFVRDVSKDDYRWNRPNKNYLSSGIYLPGLYSEKLGEVVVIIDDSGSCYGEIPQFLSEAISIFENFPGTFMHLVTCDTEPTHVLDWEQGQDEPGFEPNVKVVGGGGTSFVKPFDMIEEKEWKPRCVIYLTDLDGEIPDISKDPGCPVLWVVNNDRHQQDELAFGELCVFTKLAAN